jgi:putative PEP-CTERM system TPR-repeat lipoprotein
MPDQLAVHAGIVESRIALADLPGAEAGLRALDAMARDAFVTRYLRARLAYLRGDYPVAIAELQRALSGQPGNPAARLLLGAALIEQGSVEQAESELSRLVAEYPDNVEARRLLAQIYLSHNDAAGATRLLADAPTVAVQHAGLDWLSGAVLLLGGQTAEAVEKFEQAAAAKPENVFVRLDLARAYLMAGRQDDAAKVLAALPAGEGGAVRRQLTVLAEIAGRDPVAARQGLARLVRENPKDALLLTAAGAQQLTAGDRAAARATLRQAVAADAQLVDARLALAAALLTEGDTAGGEKQLRKSLELDPKSERASIGLARIALARADRTAAKQILERAIGEEPAAVESRLVLAELALQDKDPARMNALLEQVLSMAKNRPYALNRVGQVLLQASQYDAALTRFSDAASAGIEEANVNAAVTLIALGRTDDARGRLEASVRQRPGWAAPVAYLVALDAGQQRYEQALARIGALEQAGGPAWAANELRGDVHVAAGQHADAIAAFENAFQERPTSSLAVKLFRVRTAAGMRSPEASLESWLERQPRDPLPRVLLAEHHQRKGDRKAAIAQYERILENTPAPEILNNLAWLYYEGGDQRAAGLAKRAYDAAADNPEIADTYGWILVESKQVKAGLPILEKAAKAAPENGEIQYHYAAALARSSRREDALRVLETLLQSAVAFPSRGAAENLLRSLTSG